MFPFRPYHAVEGTWAADVDVRNINISLLSIFLVLLSMYSGHRTVLMYS